MASAVATKAYQPNLSTKVIIEMENDDWPSEAMQAATQLVNRDGSDHRLSVVDVGAHKGETLRHFSSLITGKFDYFGFEPNPESFTELMKAVDPQLEDSQTVEFFPVAVGASTGSVTFRIAGASEVSGVLVPEAELLVRVPAGDHELKKEIRVPQICIDDFILQQDLAKVHVLKVDTEGYDLEVLRGAKGSLKTGIVDIVLCEVFFVKYREKQAYFWDIAAALEKLGYSFVNLFDTRTTGQGRLYTANAIWVSPNLSAELGYL